MAGLRFSGDPASILKAILAQLRAVIPGCTRENAYVTQQLDDEPAVAPGQFIYAVWWRPGDFDDTLIDGGGNGQLTMEAGCTVRIYSPVQLDQLGRDTIALTDTAIGLIVMAGQVLGALSLFDPQDDEEDFLLREPMIPAGMAGSPHPRAVSWLDVAFNFTFDWTWPPPAPTA